MLTLNAKNKELAYPFEGEDMDVRRALEKKEELLDELDRETNQQKCYDLRIRLAQLASLMKSLREGQDFLDNVDRELNQRRMKRAKAEREAANQGSRLFNENINLIASHSFYRFTGITPNLFDFEQATYLRPRIAKHAQQLSDGLSYEQAKEQADEILNAARDRRDWKEIIKLPRPEIKAWDLARN